jgi:ABC-type spermidine/putrescine transport system permease subunit II
MASLGPAKGVAGRFLALHLRLVYLFLYVPIAVLMVLSFN